MYIAMTSDFFFLLIRDAIVRDDKNCFGGKKTFHIFPVLGLEF